MYPKTGVAVESIIIRWSGRLFFTLAHRKEYNETVKGLCFFDVTSLIWGTVPVTDFEGHTQHVRLCKSKITMCAAYLQPRYTAEGGGRSMRAGVFYMMLFSVTFLKNSQQTMCRSDENLRSLNSFFNLDGCVYYLTKKDTFCTLYSSCKFYAVCVRIGDFFLIWKKCGNWCCTSYNDKMTVTSSLSRVLGRKNIETEMRCCCMRTACLKTDTATYLWLEVTPVDR